MRGPALALPLVAPILLLALGAGLGSATAVRAELPPDTPEACRSTVDDPPPAHGPRDHRVVQATSSDGVTFHDTGRPPLPAASVPDGIERPDGETWVYFVSGEAGRHGIHIARLSPEGDLVPFDCVRLDGMFDGHAVDPDVVLLPDGRFRLFFKADFGLPGAPGRPSIESASSADGIHFTREGPALDTGGGADPTVAQLPDGSWLMAVPQVAAALLARSADGRQFTVAGPPVPLGGIPELWVTGETVHLLGGASELRHFVSTDNGATWQEGTPLTVELPAANGYGSPSMSGAPGRFRLFLIQLPPPPSGGGVCQLAENRLCLGEGRFRVTTTWNDGRGGHGEGRARGLGRDSGYFFFFGPDNAEVLVKVLDGCAVNGSYWVFAAGLTDLEVELRVEDLRGGRAWVHHSRPGAPFPSAIDLRAFPTCNPGAP